ncbi:kelch repeat domain [Anaeramoeba flamelloides]|uniref:Kelch repeat domain n=1 Tax=Anaeramoeba flamelloides TaxID=1746091 RepID=A0ABQ8XEP1_9EUKA|nr:kelch repeat domain [Anaeramoeba flamelloides]
MTETSNLKKKQSILLIQNLTRGFLDRKLIKGATFSKPLKRRFLINEIIETEKSYIEQLLHLIHEFLHPIKDKKILNSEQIDKIFNNIVLIYKLNQNLYLNLEKRKSDITTLKWTDIWNNFVPFLKLYSVFISNYDSALESLHYMIKKSSKFSNFLKKTNKLRVLEGKTIFDLLIAPVQRIPRYVLLIEGIIKCMRSTHSERDEFQKVLEKLKSVAEHVNKNKSVTDNFRKLMSIQIKIKNSDELLEIKSGRSLILEQSLIEKDHPNPEKSWGILFSDIFVYATKLGKEKFVALEIFPINKTVIKNYDSLSGVSNDFDLKTHNRTLHFHCNSSREKTMWLSSFESIHKENEKRKRAVLPETRWIQKKTIGKIPPPINWSQGCIYNDSFYMFGGKEEGLDEDILNDKLYLLEIKKWKWSIVKKNENNLPCARFGHSMSIIDDSIYLFGGTNGKMRFDDLHLYLISDNIWKNNPETYGDPPTKRSGHSASVIENQIWIFGGRSEKGNFLNDLYCFDTDTYTWYNIEMNGLKPRPRAWHTGNFIDDQLIIFGGGSFQPLDITLCINMCSKKFDKNSTKTFNDVWVYSLTGENWYEADVKGKQPEPRYAHSSVLLKNCLWLIGGVAAFEKVVELTILDMDSASWNYVNESGDIPKVNSRQVSCLLDPKDEQVLVFGGELKGNYSNDVHIFTPNISKVVLNLEDLNLENKQKKAIQPNEIEKDNKKGNNSDDSTTENENIKKDLKNFLEKNIEMNKNKKQKNTSDNSNIINNRNNNSNKNINSAPQKMEKGNGSTKNNNNRTEEEIIKEQEKRNKVKLFYSQKVLPIIPLVHSKSTPVITSHNQNPYFDQTSSTNKDNSEKGNDDENELKLKIDKSNKNLQIFDKMLSKNEKMQKLPKVNYRAERSYTVRRPPKKKKFRCGSEKKRLSTKRSNKRKSVPKKINYQIENQSDSILAKSKSTDDSILTTTKKKKRLKELNH